MSAHRWWLTSVLAAYCVLAHAQAAEPVTPHQPIDKVLGELEDYIEASLRKTHVPGLAAAVVYQDRVVYLKAFGVREAGKTAKVDPDTVFQLASVSKPLASTVVAGLVGDGEVRWDSKIADLDPAFELSDPTVTAEVTIADLLSHRSGLPGLAGDILEDLGFSRPEILHQVRLIKLVGAFRDSYAYSNFGYTEGGIAPAKKVGQSWEDLADRRLFSRLGMNSSSYRWSDYRDRVNKAAIHVFADGRFVPRYLRIPDAEAPAGSASSSVRDLAQWLRLQLANGKWNGEQVIAAAALQETHTKQVKRGTDPVTGEPSYYGLGWDVDSTPDGRVMLSHSGAFILGAATTVKFSPSDQLGIVVLTNTWPVGLPEAVAATFFDFYQYGKPTQDWLALAGAFFKKLREDSDNSSTDYSKLKPPTSPAPPQPSSTYVGTYSNDYYGSIEVTENHGLLWLRLPADGSLYNLIHWDGDTFIYRFRGDPSLATRGVKFKPAADGGSVEIENLALEGDGVFLKQR
jgi:CubicO group peptidase (beta-lactamase class C family)